jgi:signal transduction histidine kinase/ActR/RegA family two-component response regulator
LIVAIDTEDFTPVQQEILDQLMEITGVHMLPARIGERGWQAVLHTVLFERARQYQTRELTVELEKAQVAASEGHRIKDDFLANISHEIRTPLGAVLGFCELLAEGKVDESERQVYLDTIRRNGQQLADMIADVLELSHAQKGSVAINRSQFTLDELLTDVMAEFSSRAARQGIALRLRRDEHVPKVVNCDPLRLKQILRGLLSNAFKFTGHGSISVAVRGEAIDERHFLLRIEIEDTGVGIAPTQVANLFQPFSQVDSSSTRRFGGLGMGLVLARKLAVAMGGNVDLAWSIPGGGSCFFLEAPLEIVRAADWCANLVSIRSANIAAADSALPLRGTRMLVVDDSLDNQMLIGRILQMWGAEVEMASDGEEAVEKATGQSFNVILMDLQMPKLGGLEATRILRDRGCKDPIVALTARTLTDDYRRCLSMGCTDYLTKPIQKERLVRVLEKVTRQPLRYSN